MFLIEPDPTPYDLRFRLFRIPVRVHPIFWLFSAALGWPNLPPEMRHMTIPFVLAWVGCVFVSILIHEMGHVFAGRLFGADGHIVLYSFGGLAVGSSAVPGRWQRVFVFFAGPLAQFVLLGVVLAVVRNVIAPPEFRGLLGPDWRNPLSFINNTRALLALSDLNLVVKVAVDDLIVINLFWPILNLLPIWPLDGGQISRELFGGLMPARGLRVSLGVSMLVAGLLALNGIVLMQRGTPLLPVVGRYIGTSWFSVIFFGLMALGSYQALQQAEHEKRWTEDHWER